MDIAHPRQIALRGAAALVGGWTRFIPLLLAAAGTVGLFFAVDALAPDSRLHTLLWDRGFSQPLTVGLFFWGVGHIVRRLVVHSGERRALGACRGLLWTGPVERDGLAGRLEVLGRLRDTLAGEVLYAVLSYFRSHRPTRDELLEAARQAVDRAHDRVEDDYRPLTAAMWLLPLSGFLGTVVGMAGAIASFDGVITGVGDDLAALIPAVSGLAVAFDTTLLALALVVPLKLLEVGLEGRDKRLLERIERDLGAGYVQRLDLAGLAQQTPAEAALDRQAETVARIERSMRAIDGALAQVARRLEALPPIDGAVAELVQAARETREALPRVTAELGALRRQGQQPMILRREPGPGRPPEPTRGYAFGAQHELELPDSGTSDYTLGDLDGEESGGHGGPDR